MWFSKNSPISLFFARCAGRAPACIFTISSGEPAASMTEETCCDSACGATKDFTPEDEATPAKECASLRNERWTTDTTTPSSSPLYDCGGTWDTDPSHTLTAFFGSGVEMVSHWSFRK